ncbi:MAG: ACP S-malonyltransferase [Planctomycetota bacterium]
MTTEPTHTPALLFPGQGAQFEGMGRDWAEAFPVARATWAEADEVLGFALSEACWSRGDEVHRTDIAQPGIYTTGVAIVRVLESLAEGANRIDRAAVPLAAGLSLGEYTAHWAAGTFSFADGLKLVRLRGEAMQAASEACPSGMLSLMGASLEQAEGLAAVGARVGICQVANLNSPGQIVLSGELAALDAVEAAAREHGVRRARRLVVAGGFHSECMRPAAERLAAALAGTQLQAPRVPVLSNVTAEAVTSIDEVRRTLGMQVCAPVLWERSMRASLAQGVRSYVEPGPGTVLGSMLGKIAEAVVAEQGSPLTPPVSVRSAARPGDLTGDLLQPSS